MTKPFSPDTDWWRSAVIYQVYPRSFADSNADGIGDLQGITARLDHIAKLGADAVWLSPFFKSPMKDFGYDISDYCDVDPMFGNLDDFRALVKRAHALGLKVIIDQVLSHCSDQHPWFVESRASRDNPRANWYVWADAKPDGSPPNNWLSIFGGSAWQWDTRRCQYYFHNFLVSQPDLNFHNPAVQEAQLASMKFWLDLGVDGFRMDAINYCFHDAELRNNPGLGTPASTMAAPAINPYTWQEHLYDKNRPEMLDFLRRIRQLLNQYPGATSIGEIGDGIEMVAQYTSGGDKLHMAYCFDFLGRDHSAPYLHGVVDRFQRSAKGGWPSWALSNHDVARVASRWGGASPSAQTLRTAAALPLCLQGSACIYQGEELGLPEAEVAFEDLQDPYGITMWPEFKGRDGCRTPMPWDSQAPDAGFCGGSGSGKKKPWLPVAKAHHALAVDAQEADPQSLLQFYRRLLRWRRKQPALMHGDMRLLPVNDHVFAFVREHQGVKLLCAFNLAGQSSRLTLDAGQLVAAVIEECGLSGAAVKGNAIDFEPWGALIARLA